MPTKKSQKTSPTTTSLWTHIQDNYTSLIVGLVSLIVIAVVLYKYLPLRNSFQKVGTATTTTSSAEVTNEPTVTSIPAPTQSNNTYIVQQGDNLWKIAEEYYGSGYNAYDIALANNLDDANNINVREKLVIPLLTPTQSTVGEITETAAQTERVKSDATSYIVKHGDSLWSIAIALYGDGYQWTSIAETNHLAYPNFIHVGNTLQIPRNANTK